MSRDSGGSSCALWIIAICLLVLAFPALLWVAFCGGCTCIACLTPDSSDPACDYLECPRRWKGRNVSLNDMQFYIPEDHAVQDYAGKSVRIIHHSEGTKPVALWVFIPEEAKEGLPDLEDDDLATVSFQSMKGSLSEGNVVYSVAIEYE